jgi:hypothetical protein
MILVLFFTTNTAYFGINFALDTLGLNIYTSFLIISTIEAISYIISG